MRNSRSFFAELWFNNEGLKLNLFMSKPEEFPKLCLGYVLRIHRLKVSATLWHRSSLSSSAQQVQHYGSGLQGLGSKRRTSCLAFAGDQMPMMGGTVNHTFTEGDRARAKELHEWYRGLVSAFLAGARHGLARVVEPG